MDSAFEVAGAMLDPAFGKQTPAEAGHLALLGQKLVRPVETEAAGQSLDSWHFRVGDADLAVGRVTVT